MFINSHLVHLSIAINIRSSKSRISTFKIS